MLILADNDVGGAIMALRRVLESEEWIEFTVWYRCQEIGAVLITGNRASGTESLEQVIRDHTEADSLPAVTIGDPQRVVREPAYARSCAISLLDLLERLDALRGTGRLFIS
jgi:hypothetical protein